MLRGYICKGSLLSNESGAVWDCDIQIALTLSPWPYSNLEAVFAPLVAGSRDDTVIVTLEAPPETHVLVQQLEGVTQIGRDTRLPGMPEQRAATPGDRVIELEALVEPGLAGRLPQREARKHAYE
jgi:hypothetical protein